jgi:hypothetical protein
VPTAEIRGDRRASVTSVVSSSVAVNGSDVWTVEFQGSVVKTKFTNFSRPSSAPDDSRWFPLAHQQLFHQLVMSYPAAERVRLPDGSFTVEIAPERWAALESEAWLLAAETKRLHSSRGKRGAVVGFSRKSRKRLLEVCGRLAADVEGLFLTLTYQANYQDAVGAKYHLDLMLRWLRYHRPGCSVIWRMEHQGRGAIHFHLLILGTTWLAVRGIRHQWRSLVGDLAGNIDIERIHNRRKAMSYVAKYIAKPVEAPSAGPQVLRLDYLPYSENSEIASVSSDDLPAENPSAAAWFGRFWGIVGRAWLPLAEMIKFEFVGSPAALMDFRRAARRYKPGLFRRSAINGFTLFVRDVHQWLKLWYCCEDGRSLFAHVISGEQTALRVARGGPVVSYAF